MPEAHFVRPEDRLTIEQAAEYLGVAVPTMYSWRTKQYGPRAIRLGRRGRLIYPRAEVEQWARDQLGYGPSSRRSA